jgi:hypothetical protein
MTKSLLPQTPSTFPPALSDEDRELLITAALVVKTLGAQFPQMSNNAADRQLMVSEWSKGLRGMTPREISRGLAACRTQRFVPGLGEFCQFCRPALDPETAWLEAQDGLAARERGELGAWSHPAVFRAATAMPFEVRSITFGQARKRWERALRQEFEKGWGEDVPAVPKRVEHRPTLKPMPAAMRKKLADLSISKSFT